MNLTNNQPHTPKVPLGGFRGLRFFRNFGKKLQTALKRFPITFVSIIVLAIILSLNIEVWNAIPKKWVMCGIVSALATLAFYLFAENRFGKLLTDAVNIVSAGLIIWLFSGFPKEITDANYTQFAMLLGSFLLALFFAGFLTEKYSLRWWDNLQHMLFHLIISWIFAGILMGGLSLAIFSLDELFGLEIHDNTYEYLAVFCFVLFMPSYFMSQIPFKSSSDTKLSITYLAIYKILGLYILLPILAVYTVILYGYLAKIIATWELPNGWVSWLVSILGFMGFFAMIVLHPLSEKDENRIANFFSRYFPFILLPLLILMFVGIIRRFSDYGITINRLLVLILNIWFFGISIYLFISSSRQPKWILISFATITFFATVGPWSVINVTEKSLKKEFSALLAEANWTNSRENQIKPLSEEKQNRLSDVAYYLQSAYGVESIRPMFSSLGETATARSLISRLGFATDETKEKYFYIKMPYSKSFDFDVKDYGKSYYLAHSYSNKNQLFKSNEVEISLIEDSLVVKGKKTETTIPLITIIEKGINRETKFEPKELTIESSNYKLIVFNLHGEFNRDNSVEIDRFEGLLLLK